MHSHHKNDKIKTMTVKRSRTKKSNTRKPFWERILELFLLSMKKLLIPALAVWLITWLWLGGVFATTKNMMWNGFVDWTATQGLIVDDVIIDGRTRTNLPDIKKAINIKIGAPILSVNVNKIQSNIAQLPWTDTATISRNYNGTIIIQITERIPFVLWDRPGRKQVVVDTKGNIIKGAPPSDFAKLLSVRGVDAPQYSVELMQMILVEPNIAEHIRGAEWIGDRRWDLMTTKGTRIHMPENDMGYALARLAKIQNEKNILRQDLLSIDLRADDRIIIESKRGRSRDLMNLSSAQNTNNI